MRRVFGAGDYQYEVVENWGRSGERPKLGLVSSVAVDSQDNVYVFQRSPEAVMLVFDPDGTLMRTWGQDIFVEPHGVWIGPDDTIYTADSLDHTVRCFTGRRRIAVDARDSRSDRQSRVAVQPADLGRSSAVGRAIRLRRLRPESLAQIRCGTAATQFLGRNRIRTWSVPATTRSLGGS